VSRASDTARSQEEKGNLSTPSAEPRVAELEEELRQLRLALEARGRRLVSDQLAYAEHVQARDLVIARLLEDIKILEAEIEGRKQAYQDLINTRTFRYTARLRALYSAARRWLGRR
jgi:hypothetical protein